MAVVMAIFGLLSMSACALNHEMPNYSSQDIMFAQMMIPHHQQAVEMGTLAETRAEDLEVKALAAEIKAEQAPEIEEMKSWLSSAKVGLDMGHQMPMEGLLTDVELTELENASGTNFDRLYVVGMIGHHQGAIVMAEMVLDSSNPNAKAMGESIVKSQTQQIETLKGILSRLDSQPTN